MPCSAGVSFPPPAEARGIHRKGPIGPSGLATRAAWLLLGHPLPRPSRLPLPRLAGRADPVPVGEALRARWCARGVPVEWQDYPLDHVTTALTGMPAALDWMAARLADEPTRGNCTA
ncbi:lipase family protein [Stenotrophomonas sp. NPDC087984]